MAGTIETNTGDDTGKLVRLWWRKQITGLLILMAILFASAGTLSWPAGWLYTGVYAATIIAQAIVVLPRQPGLIAERAKLQQGTKFWDIALTLVAIVLLPMVSWAIAGLDYRYGWTAAQPVWIPVAGLLLTALGWGIVIWSMASNPYFSATVRIQAERDHHTVSSGPYRFIRHPGYVGTIIFHLAMPLVVGSLPAFYPNLVTAALLVLRTALEDRTLRDELPGYREYAARTRYRLIPGVW
ncbi:MAG: isoprenylcysteine carboxylmethyltransferase family protein [Chloroflexota bacterium]|nr:MAG: isoprenylcysteine carboxylmethyltransferase family protein [Chloroflexota bacterium]